MKKYVRISSTKFINVYPSLLNKDITPKNDALEDRLNVETFWDRLGVRIIEGVAYYPAVITTWNSVQSLAKQEVITIGNEMDDLSGIEDAEKVKYAESLYKELSNVYKNIENKGIENPFKEKQPTPKKSTSKPAETSKNLIDDAE